MAESCTTEDEILQELEDDDDLEYYTLLNINKDATPEQIRSAYRKLCRLYHPDRHHDTHKQQTAANFFKRIQEAYRVLSDPRTKALYDRNGRKGLQNDMALIERSTLPTELLGEYEKMKKLWDERTYIQEVNPQATFQMDIDASRLVDGPYDGSKPFVSVQKVTLNQSVDANLTKVDIGNIAGTVSASEGALFGGIQFSLRHLISNQNWVRVAAMLGTRPGLGLDFYHSLSECMYVMFRNVISFSSSGIFYSANGSITRRLTDRASGTLSVKESGNSAGIEVNYSLSPTTDLTGEVCAGFDSSYVKTTVHYHPEGKYSFRGGVKVGTRGVSVSYGADQVVANMTRVGATVVVGTEVGVALKLRLTRATMAYATRIQVSQFLSAPAACYATFVPLVLYGCFTVFALGPFLRRQKLKDIEERTLQKSKELLEKKRDAEAAVELMRETVERIVSAERARHGLIIIEAWYGKLYDTAEGYHTFSPKVIDVTVPLQCLVVDSKLILHDTSKVSIPGFYDPCIGEKKYLRVRYEFRGQLHEVTVENAETLIIPRHSHRIIKTD